eukprot:1153122-Pelagomonas_calceolata.AAC.5
MSGGLPLPKYHPERQREPGMHPEKCAILIQPFKTQWKPGAHHLLFCFNHSEIASLDCVRLPPLMNSNDAYSTQQACTSQDSHDAQKLVPWTAGKSTVICVLNGA